LAKLTAQGFKTVFVFGELIATGIEAEFAAFDTTSLLFLRHIRQVDLKSGVEALTTVRRESVNLRTRSVRLAASQGVTNWTITERDGVALAFIHDEAGIARLEEGRAVIHAFLPTLEGAGSMATSQPTRPAPGSSWTSAAPQELVPSPDSLWI
jgi:hypothetical protein